jgi:hypothetical protein
MTNKYTGMLLELLNDKAVNNRMLCAIEMVFLNCLCYKIFLAENSLMLCSAGGILKVLVLQDLLGGEQP